MPHRPDREKKLRRGFTTGSCAAAGAKAAALLLFCGVKPSKVVITLPRGGELDIKVKSVVAQGTTATATIVKDAGDDPDVTNKAEIVTSVERLRPGSSRTNIRVMGGVGVGVVTKPGLKAPIGHPAINPVPMQMIRASVKEALKEAGVKAAVVVTVSVPKGELLAKKTMNARLGIMGGISILGTTGIVEPMSLEAYTHSISCGVDVLEAAGIKEVVFSTGRSSEKVMEKTLNLPETAFIIVGDHMGYAMKDTLGRPLLERITIAAQFGKMSKLASGHFDTHCEDSSVDLGFLASLCPSNEIAALVRGANTARQVFFILKEAHLESVLKEVCLRVRSHAQKDARQGIDVKVALVGYDDDIERLI
ncbi:MAG: cobalt-precorrin-5B (C(1))-methyltransferase [Deltaproteobacteria bacterium]|nr:cobalt-precorrin-5B (C(1))-methyltransferase [Deltaproteobacteria bacterium]